ncbi:MAG: hypothetical protein ACP5VR_01800 [Acidimicrobiales bacterium]
MPQPPPVLKLTPRSLEDPWQKPTTGPQGQPTGSGSHSLSERLANWAHLATLVGTFAFWAVMDRHLWFFGDEWSFLVRRGLWHWPGSKLGIWFPHNEHWSTLPILLWRGLYNVFHLSTYMPYLVPLLLAQVGVVHLAWRLCRREGTGPWVATAVVAVLGFLGAGSEDLAWAFQIGFVGSVLFGLLAFDLLERRPPGPETARLDALASVALLASLMCSTVGDAMVAGGAVLIFARRPWRRALRVLALPVGSYVIWFALIGHLGLRSHADQLTSSTVTGLPAYVWTGLSSALGQALNFEAAGAAALVGLAAWVLWQAQHLWEEHPSLLGLSTAAVTFYVLVALGRDALGDSQTVSRYVYVAIAILVPVIGQVLGRASRALVPQLLVIGLLLATVLGNVGQAQSYLAARQQLVDGLRTSTEATARLLAAGVQDVAGPSAQPIRFEPTLNPVVLAGLQRSHLLPPAKLTPLDMVNARTLLAVALGPRQVSNGRLELLGDSYAVASASAGGCRTFAPESVSQPMQIWLQLLPGETSASVQVTSPPAAAELTNYLAAVIVPRQGPSTSNPAELAMPASGLTYVSYNDPDAKLVLLWNVGTPLKLCGLEAAPAK